MRNIGKIVLKKFHFVPVFPALFSFYGHVPLFPETPEEPHMSLVPSPPSHKFYNIDNVLSKTLHLCYLVWAPAGKVYIPVMKLEFNISCGMS